jgi:hypothetical protein
MESTYDDCRIKRGVKDAGRRELLLTCPFPVEGVYWSAVLWNGDTIPSGVLSRTLEVRKSIWEPIVIGPHQ